METVFPFLIGVPVLFLLALALVPTRVANRTPGLLGFSVTLGTAFALLASLATGCLVIQRGALEAVWRPFQATRGISIGLFLDSVAIVMFALISFIGLIIGRFANRYLHGDANQGRFFRWMSLTLGATLLMAVSANLALFMVAWILTSLGLHQLLSHYPDRPWAVWAARKKFLISRLGDLLLIAAMALTFHHAGTLEYPELFEWAKKVGEIPRDGQWTLTWIGILFVLGAMTKSAQVPFHTWLPDTMETPTPVSALMHAGVINAGGFLVIRLSPVIALSPLALDLLAVAGATTAFLGSVVMLTQTSIKRSLAYSTVAQMGFMMLQCGLGAFSAAMLHIVAHSAYKAHAFLRSGSVLEKAAGAAPVSSGTTGTGAAILARLVAPLIAVGLVALGFYLLGANPLVKPGGLLLGLVMVLALTQLMANSFASGQWALSRVGLTGAIAVCAAYFAAFAAMDHLVGPSLPVLAQTSSPLATLLMVLVALGFLGVFMLQALPLRQRQSPWMRSLYVHAMNAFYIDIPARRLTARFYGQSTPAP